MSKPSGALWFRQFPTIGSFNVGGCLSVQFAVLPQAHARVLKCAPERARMGVKELWTIDPEEKDVAVYPFDQDPTEPVTTHSGEMEVSSPLPPDLTISLPEISRRG